MDLGMISGLVGLDVVAVGLWPGDDPWPRAEHPAAMPPEVRCVDPVTAERVRALAGVRAAAAVELSRRGMHYLVDRAERHPRGGLDGPGAD
ncbi:hypothetical protein LQ327_00085 [Actinomycetospora endophytica]|uniref:Uncharacterized protein n=1 Tax=Actinomycetospora endophytica TaxID=2291215 RepID=A0ABS8P0K0_9PSEU|nr:hypothetical protein [Actinomycetospora endophytica]MCD2191789.1 hypothetical protein [Actinomycetospora endophytica]